MKRRKHIFPKVRARYWIKYLFKGCPCHDCTEPRDDKFDFNEGVKAQQLGNLIKTK